MQDIADFELQKEPGSAPPPGPRPPSFIPLIVGALVLLAGAGAYFYTRQEAAPVAEPGTTTSTEANVEATRPLGADVAPVELPPLDETDAVVRELVRALSSHPRITAWLTTDGLIRNFTVVVDNIAAGRTPANHLRILRPKGSFPAVDAGGTMVMGTRGYDRYNDLAAAVGSVDADGAARLYTTLKPRIEDAYRELGQSAPFDRAIEGAIVHLLRAPAVQGEIALIPRGALYNYNDSRIEGLSQAQKQLIRMGPRNMRVIQRKLRDIALALGIPPERLPER